MDKKEQRIAPPPPPLYENEDELHETGQQNNNRQRQNNNIGANNKPAASLDAAANLETKIYNNLIDDVIFRECLQVHRAAKMGLIFTEAGDELYKIKDGLGLDVFGQPLSKKKQLNCICPQCGRNLAASRLAPHLEKCMGMGRLSARAASNKRGEPT